MKPRAELTAVTANPKKNPMATWKTMSTHEKIIPLQVCGRDEERGVTVETPHMMDRSAGQLISQSVDRSVATCAKTLFGPLAPCRRRKT